jgi:hypothetical protein
LLTPLLPQIEMATLHLTKSTTTVPERIEEDNQRLFQLYKGWTLTERDGQVRQWVYQFGYDIQQAGESIYIYLLAPHVDRCRCLVIICNVDR